MKKIKLKGLEEEIITDTCENGLSIYIWVNKKVNTFNGAYVVPCGSETVNFEIKKKKMHVPFGTAHFLEHILCKKEDGTSLLGDFNELGSYSNAATFADKTVFEFLGSNHLKENLELLLNSVQEKKFVKEHFESERGPILEEARMQKDNAGRLAHYEIQNCLFHNYPNRIQGLGTIKDIENMKLEDLETLYKSFYHPKNCFVIVTGNVNPLEVITVIKENQKKKHFEEFVEPKEEKYKEPKKVVTTFKELKANIEVPQVYISVKIPRKNFDIENDMLLLDMLNLILVSNFGTTSLFREKLFENNLALTIGSWAVQERDYLVLQVSARTKYPTELIPLLKDKMEHLELLESDIKRKVKSEIANLVLGYEDPESVKDNLAYLLIKYGKIIDNEKELLESIHLKSVQKVYEKMTMKEMNVFVLNPKKKTKE